MRSPEKMTFAKLVHRIWIAALPIGILCVACACESDRDEPSLDAALEVDANMAPDASHAPDAAGDAGDAEPPSLAFGRPWSEEELCAVENEVPDCCAEGRVELPETAASVLDLRELTPGAPGTCGDPTKRLLPEDPSAYPLMVLLPAFTEADPFCETACAGRGRATAFGVVLELPSALAQTYRPAIVAPPPWRYVYDHNSLAGDCCLDGFQEFGERACVRPNYGGYIGFATDVTSTPTQAAIIALGPGENGGVDTCCPYLPNVP